MASNISRRKFLNTGAKAALGLSFIQNTVFGQSSPAPAPVSVSPNEKLNILGIGVGGRGAAVLDGLKGQNIIGL